MTGNLVFLAGEKALTHIRERGLGPDDVKVVLGAAGGPKWLMLARMDRFLFGRWLPQRTKPLHLLGSSIGAWRHAMYSKPDPMAAHAAFLEGYVNQRYHDRPTPAEITEVIQEVLDTCLRPEDPPDILAHPTYRLTIVTARGRGPLGTQRQGLLAAGLTACGLSNLISKKGPSLFFERVIFQQEPGPFYGSKTPTTVSLIPDNLRDALNASGSIPMVMEPVAHISGAPKGVYRDGGLLDYHFDIPIHLDEGIALFPHFTQRIVPGWFDKSLKWRKPNPDHITHTLLVAPSQAFIDKLPRGRITDRTDFEHYRGRNDSRITYWHAILGETERLADELADIFENNRLAEVVRPFPY